MKPVVLIILDGWGIGENNQGNPIWQTETPTFDWIQQNFPALALQASGIAVGLPWGEEGNSEVGHLTIGAGKVLYQHFPRITMAIKDGSFFSNPALTGAFAHAKQTGGRVHFLGLLTSGNVHASFEHLVALLKLAKSQGMPNVALHLFTDGKDSLPNEAPKLLEKLKKEMSELNVGEIASLSGRFYALDRNLRWNRTERVWSMLIKGIPVKENADIILQQTYSKGLTDEFVEPTMIGTPEQAKQNTIKPGDALIFFDFREDSILQLAEVFANPEFQGFERPQIENLYIATMTEYRPNLTPNVAFPPQMITNPLAKVLSDLGKRQLHIAESEKAAHVTYFFDGLRSEPFEQEFWVIVPSPKAFSIEENPELAANEIMNRTLQALDERIYDFIVVNFANPDLVAHTGNFEAATKVVKLMDSIINRITRVCLSTKSLVIVTSDHGNIERMLNPITGMVETKHDISPVPFYLIDHRFYRPKSDLEIKSSLKEIHGSLADIAPTILNLMDINKPPEMTGESLLPLCR